MDHLFWFESLMYELEPKATTVPSGEGVNGLSGVPLIENINKNLFNKTVNKLYHCKDPKYQ